MIYITIIIIVIISYISAILIKDSNNIVNANHIEKNKEILIFVSIRNYDNELINFINNTNISGIIINIDNLNIDYLTNLINKIKSKANRKILISLDQDYKSTYNIAYHQNFKVYPSYIGERKSEEYAYKISYERALKLKSIGINMILAPVCNTYCNEKSHLKENIFTKDKILASKLIYQTVKAQKDAGIITAVKYFPKYYNDELYIREEKNNIYSMIDSKETFISAIKANADIIVMPHIKSNYKYKDILINDMNFKGIIMTDYINNNENIINYGINVFLYNDYKIMRNNILNNIKEIDLKVCSKILKLIKKS